MTIYQLDTTFFLTTKVFFSPSGFIKTLKDTKVKYRTGGTFGTSTEANAHRGKQEPKQPGYIPTS